MSIKGITWTEKFADDFREETLPKYFNCKILNNKQEIVFEQNDVKAPAFWSDQAVTIFADKYFRGNKENDNRETSVFGVINRVIQTIKNWGLAEHYFKEEKYASVFERDLYHILVNQLASFNSPVWFNFGVENEKHQGSACFILEVLDNMKSITGRAVEESILFQNGSGSGANNSRLRGSMEPLSRGGYASGPVSFMKGWDAFAGIIKSGGKNRRAAKMEVLDIDHPDIVEFIRCKWIQEKKAWALKKCGFGSNNINEMEEVFHQNANHSVRISNEFMQAVEEDRYWKLIGRIKQSRTPLDELSSSDPRLHTKNHFCKRMIDDEPGPMIEQVKARDIWNDIVECAWECGDPGIIFNDSVNEMNTVAWFNNIESSNPCAEFFHPNNTACNLASINISKFCGLKNEALYFDRDSFCHVVRTLTVAMDIIAGNAYYPTKKITENSIHLRPLGLGYCGVGHALMSMGLPYDSNHARSFMAKITAIMTGTVYLQSSELMEHCEFIETLNRENMLSVMDLHSKAINESLLPSSLKDTLSYDYINNLWKDVINSGKKYGYRNSQATAIAPTGTIALGMGIGHSTGIEPLWTINSLEKKMTGSGTTVLNSSEAIQSGLAALGHPGRDINEVRALIKGEAPEGTLEYLKSSHVFDTAGDETMISSPIHYMGHLQMMAAVQPFVSGGISKTVNLPNSATKEDISNTYKMAWKLKLKAVALYRDGSKFEQPYQSQEDLKASSIESEDILEIHSDARVIRKVLPDERPSITHKAYIGGQKFYITAGMYPDSMKLAEVFVTTAKEGSTVRGLFDTVATLISVCLQYGVPLDTLVNRFKDTRFEPNGVTHHRNIPIALSPIDYIVRWLEWKFLSEDDETEESEEDEYDLTEEAVHTGTICSECGGLSVRTGRCYICTNCGVSTGCG